ncbi:MAG: Rrf2 family transcriptional regulator [Clostridia bacterium]|nr:Rrf2 family transcriptional regulator [Clostridia bacterium]
MMISTRGRYALRMMIDLAEHNDEGFIPLKEIAKRQDISKKYLEQIIPILNRSGLLLTSRGFGGGYRLNKPAKDYTVWEILITTEGDMAPVTCLEGGNNTCPRRFECATLPVWQGLRDVVEDYLSSVTLQDIIDNQKNNSGNFYSI